MARKSKDSNKLETSKQSKTRNSNHAYEIGQRVRYVGGIHTDYKHMECTIIDKSSKNHRLDYTVLFNDGKKINCILERALELVVDKNINENSKTEENINENSNC